MYAILSILFKAINVVAILLIIRYGYLAATESDSPRKGKSALIASLAFSLWFFCSSLILFLDDHTRPIFEMQGQIDSVLVHDSSSKYYSADIRIHTNTGGYVTVHASDRSQGFRPGEAIRVKYRGDTGELIETTFYSSDSKSIGNFYSTLNLRISAMMLVGLFCAWVSIGKYRRDPEGRES